jgi:hypothetical protein
LAAFGNEENAPQSSRSVRVGSSPTVNTMVKPTTGAKSVRILQMTLEHYLVKE